MSIVIKHAYVEWHTPEFDVHAWQDAAIDGNWFYVRNKSEHSPAYCGSSYFWDKSQAWGSDAIKCLSPHTEQTDFFVVNTNEVRVAFSIANGTEWKSQELGLYQDIEYSTIVFQPSVWTTQETSELFNCRAYDLDGNEIPSRWHQIYPNRNESRLMLSLKDIFYAAGVTPDDIGNERAMLRLQGIQLVAHIDVKNYHMPFVFDSNLTCKVSFKVLRDQFTVVQRFYTPTGTSSALQYGLRLKIIGTGSIGYPSAACAIATFVVGLAMINMATVVTDIFAQFVHPKREMIISGTCKLLDLEREKVQQEQGKEKHA